jgi:hypothetical protein
VAPNRQQRCLFATCGEEGHLDSATAATTNTIGDQFEGRAMWPMTDAGAVLFIMTVALLVALAQVAG